MSPSTATAPRVLDGWRRAKVPVPHRCSSSAGTGSGRNIRMVPAAAITLPPKSHCSRANRDTSDGFADGARNQAAPVTHVRRSVRSTEVEDSTDRVADGRLSKIFYFCWLPGCLPAVALQELAWRLTGRRDGDGIRCGAQPASGVPDSPTTTPLDLAAHSCRL